MSERQSNANISEPVDEFHGITDRSVIRGEEFPVDLEARFEAIFSAVGNSEAKQLTLLSLGRNPLTPVSLHQRFVMLSEGVWRTGHGIQADYCRYSLVPNGLVAEQSIILSNSGEEGLVYSLTDAGERFGQPIAAYLLSKSAELPSSYITIFGTTSRGPGQTRSVATRASILEYLNSQNTTVRTIDVAGELQADNNSIGRHLKHLNMVGLVEYDSVNSEKFGLTKFQLEDEAQQEKITPVRNRSTLTREVAEVCFEVGLVDADLIYERLKDKHPDSKEAVLRHSISGILSGLTKQHILKRGKFKRGEALSQARITEQGRIVVREIIDPIKRILSGDEELLESWRRIPWEQYAARAVNKHRESSGFANCRSMEGRISEALSIISQNPGIRPNAIRTEINYNPNNLLHHLLKSDRVRKIRAGTATRYYIVGTTTKD